MTPRLVMAGGRGRLLLDGVDDRRRPTPDGPAGELGRPPVIPGRGRDAEPGAEAPDGDAMLAPYVLELDERG